MSTKNQLFLRCRPGDWIVKPEEGKHYKVDLDLHVYDGLGNLLPAFDLMCGAIYSDIQSAKGDLISVTKTHKIAIIALNQWTLSDGC